MSLTTSPPAWWPQVATRCYTALQEYRLVGASACADQITEAVTSVAATASEHPDVAGDLAQALAEAGRLFRALKPDTALYANSLDNLLREPLSAEAVAERAQTLLEYRRHAAQRITALAAETLENSAAILVHDYSSAVLRTLASLADAGPRDILVTECAPLGQGARVAGLVADMGHRVVYGSDCSIGRLVERADAFVTGVEGFFADGSLANTVGTLPIALLCREFGVQVIAPSELLKFDRSASAARMSDLHARLLHPWPQDPQAAGGGWEIEDHVLDAVPAHLVDCYLTERGHVQPCDVGVLAAQVLQALDEAVM